MDSAQRDQVLAILKSASDMTIATNRDDGYPQATTVSYVSDGLKIYFGTASTSQKTHNLARNGKVSLTINLPYSTWDDIRGVSMAGHAERVTDAREMERVGELMLRKFPQIVQYAGSGVGLDGVALFRITPQIVSILDYRRGFGHTELVTAAPPQPTARFLLRSMSASKNREHFDQQRMAKRPV